MSISLHFPEHLSDDRCFQRSVENFDKFKTYIITVLTLVCLTYRCKKYDVPIEKIYNKTQREKFQWAIDMAGAEFVF